MRYFSLANTESHKNHIHLGTPIEVFTPQMRTIHSSGRSNFSDKRGCQDLIDELEKQNINFELSSDQTVTDCRNQTSVRTLHIESYYHLPARIASRSLRQNFDH